MNKHWQISKNKSLEIELENDYYSSIFVFRFAWTQKEDHAGISLWIEIGKFYFRIYLYDHRHWDDKKGTWKTYSEPNKKTSKAMKE